MKKLLSILSCACAVLLVGSFAAGECVTIQSGELSDSSGSALQTGYDIWGYNYQAHMFNGTYCDAYRNASWCWDYAEIELIMKWNDAWLSNQDCDNDGKLDRHHGYQKYRGSGAWETNHMTGTYVNDVGKKCRWTDFVKIVAVPSDATCVPAPIGTAGCSGVWHDGSGAEIGPAIWGDFAVVEEVYNDPCNGYNGLLYKGARPGFGNWDDEPVATSPVK